MDQEIKKEENADWFYCAGCIGLAGLSAFAMTCCIVAGLIFIGVQSKDPTAIKLFQPTPPPPLDFVKQVSQDPKWKISLNDDFTDNRFQWDANDYHSDDIDLTRKIDGGQYVWEFEAKRPYLFWDFPEHQSLTDFIILAEFDLTQGSPYDGFGFVLRALGENHYFFEVNSRGRYMFRLDKEDEWSTLLDKTTYYLRPGESNQVVVQAKGNHFKFFINGYQIDEVEDGSLRSGYNGILLSPTGPSNDFSPSGTPTPEQTRQKVIYAVDNFKLWVPATSGSKETLSPEGGRILFTSDAAGNLDLYSVQTDGKNLRQLTSNPADDYAGKWSPDGYQIAFVSERDGNPEIYLAKSDGSDIQRLTDDPADDTDAAWSPDGTQIVFTSMRDGNAELYLYTLKSEELERLTDNQSEDRNPNWSPDGKAILFQSARGANSEIYRLDLSSRAEERLTTSNTMSAITPAWSPDGKNFVYVLSYFDQQSQLVIEGIAEELHRTLGESTVLNFWPVWSPRGDQIAYTSNRSRQTDIYIISADGKSIYQLTDDKAKESYLDWTR